MLLGILVTIKAPAHAVRLRMVNNAHFTNITMAACTAHAAVNVGRMIKIDIIWRPVHTHPLHRLAIKPFVIFVCSLADRLQLGAPCLHVLVTIPAS